MLTIFGGITLIEIIGACLLAILIHEVFHVFAARIFDYALYSFTPSPAGIRARLGGSAKSFKKQTLIFMAGPLGNLILALLFWNGSGFLKNIFEANLAIGIFNLLPMYPLDGGQIFIIVFYKLMGSNKTFKLIKILSGIIKIGLALTGILQILIFKNPSLLVAAIMLPGTKLLEEKVIMVRLENLLNRKQRITNKGIYPARHIVVVNQCTLGEILQKLDYDRFHIIYVLNEELEIVGQISEQQIIKAMQTCRSTDRICDVFFFGV